MYSCVPNNSLAYNKCHSHGLFKDPGRLLDALLNKFIKSVELTVFQWGEILKRLIVPDYD